MCCESQRSPRVIAQTVGGPLGKSGSSLETPSVETVGAASSPADPLVRVRLRSGSDWSAWDAPRLEEVGVRTEDVADSEGIANVEAMATTEVVNSAGGREGGVGGIGGVSRMGRLAEAESEPIALSVGKNSLIPACLDMVAREIFVIPLYPC